MLLRCDTLSFLFWFRFTNCWRNCFFFSKTKKRESVFALRQKFNIHKMLSLEVGHLLGAAPSAPCTERSQLLGRSQHLHLKLAFCGWSNPAFSEISSGCRFLQTATVQEVYTCVFTKPDNPVKNWFFFFFKLSRHITNNRLSDKIKECAKKEKSTVTFAGELNLTFSKQLNTHVHLFSVSVLGERSHDKL